MEPRDRLKDVSALLCGIHSRVIGAHRRRYDILASEFRQIKGLERSDTCSHPIRSHSGQFAALECKRYEIQTADNVKSESCIVRAYKANAARSWR